MYAADHNLTPHNSNLTESRPTGSCGIISTSAGPAAALAVMTTGFVIAQLGFGFWQGWWLATLGTSAVITIAVVGHPGSIQEPEPTG